MGFLLLSNQYPEESDVQAYLGQAGPHARNVSPIPKFLAASATDEQWKRVLQVIRENATNWEAWQEQSKLRPLKPNDDNYQAFTGPDWKPKATTGTATVSPAFSALLGQDNDPNTPYPRYDRCANCTKPANLQCARCKVVKYCSRDPCQSSHWKKVHKNSCTKAQHFSLWKSLHGNDGFYISPEECTALQSALSNALIHPTNSQDANVIRCFQAYFGAVANLGGCFVL